MLNHLKNLNHVVEKRIQPVFIIIPLMIVVGAVLVVVNSLKKV